MRLTHNQKIVRGSKSPLAQRAVVGNCKTLFGYPTLNWELRLQERPRKTIEIKRYKSRNKRYILGYVTGGLQQKGPATVWRIAVLPLTQKAARQGFERRLLARRFGSEPGGYNADPRGNRSGFGGSELCTASMAKPCSHTLTGNHKRNGKNEGASLLPSSAPDCSPPQHAMRLRAGLHLHDGLLHPGQSREGLYRRDHQSRSALV